MAKNKRYEKENKLIDDKRKLTVMCKCSHRVPIYKLNAKGWTVCNYCGRKIVRPQDEFKNKLMEIIKKERK